MSGTRLEATDLAEKVGFTLYITVHYLNISIQFVLIKGTHMF